MLSGQFSVTINTPSSTWLCDLLKRDVSLAILGMFALALIVDLPPQLCGTTCERLPDPLVRVA